MKKKQNRAWISYGISWRKMLMFMKFLSVLLFGVCMSLNASVLSQEIKISVNMNEVELTTVLEELSRQSRCDFFYNYALMATKGKVSVKAEKRELKLVLNELLSGLGLDYSFDGNVVVIREKGEQEEPQKKIIKIRGLVTDEGNFPLPGVTVKLKKSLLGTATNNDGKFSLEIPPVNDIVLVFSFIGMETQEVKYTGQDSIHVVLREVNQQMDEVVVTGYQVINKKKSTSAITTVKMDDIMIPGATSIDQMLEGRVADMVLMSNSGEVGVAPKIRIRGTSTLIGNREPLWVVDGIIVQDPVPISAEELNDPDYVNRIGNAIAGLNPQDIERLDILKDAAATALYGTKAANGVIVITTKKGRVGKPLVSYNMTTTFRQRPRYTDRSINLMNSKERIQFSRELNEQHFVFPEQINYVGYEGLLRDLYDGKIDDATFPGEVAKLETVNTDWFKLLTEDSFSHQHTVSLSGGSEQVRYYASIGYARDNDVIKGNCNERYTAALNLESRVIEWFTVNFQMQGNVSQRKYNQSEIAPMDYAYKKSRAIPAFDESGKYFYYLRRDADDDYKYNILNELDDSYTDQHTSGIMLTANLQFNFSSWLNANAIVSYSNSNAEIEGYWGEKTNHVAQLRDSEYGVLPGKYSVLPYGGELSRSNTRNNNYTIRLQANANKSFGVDEQHNVSLSAGFEMNSSKYNGYERLDRGYYPDRGKVFVSNVDIEKYTDFAKWLASSENVPTLTENLTNMLSAYATLSYSYKEYFTVNVNARMDGSNKFGDQSNDKLLPIWSASGAYNISEHEALKAAWIDYISLKCSFGYQGNMLDSQSPVMIIKKLPMNTYHNELASQIVRNPNPNLKWEKTSSFNVGLTFALFRNRLQLETQYYYKYTKDAFMTKDVASINGVTSFVVNGGDVENKGYNVDVTISPIMNDVWRWTLSTSFSKNYNKVKSIPSTQEYGYESFLDGTAIVKDKAINTFYSYEFVGLSPVDGGPLFNDMEDQKFKLFGVDKYSTFTQVLKASGCREPYMSGGLSTTLRYKNVRMSGMFSYALGAKTRLFRMFDKDLSPENNVHRDFLKRWQQPGDEQSTTIPALVSYGSDVYWKYSNHWSGSYNYEEGNQIHKFANDAWEMYDFSDVRVVSANYLKCSNLSFTYEFGDKILSKIKLSRLALTLSGTNLFTLCSGKLNGQTPTQGGFSEIQLSDRPTYTFGVSVSF